MFEQCLERNCPTKATARRMDKPVQSVPVTGCTGPARNEFQEIKPVPTSWQLLELDSASPITGKNPWFSTAQTAVFDFLMIAVLSPSNLPLH